MSGKIRLNERKLGAEVLDWHMCSPNSGEDGPEGVKGYSGTGYNEVFWVHPKT